MSGTHSNHDQTQGPLRIVAWGTYDLGKPRDRILLRGLRENGVEVLECHSDIWQGVEDKSQVTGWRQKLQLVANWLVAYPGLVYRYLHLPKHDAVLVPYLGQLDILVLWPIAKLRRHPIVLDAFLSLYNTVVEDRQLVGKHNPLAYALFAMEWLACHAADLVIVDTNAHGEYFRSTFHIDPKRIQRVFVGVEPECFPPAPPLQSKAQHEPLRVLFYGQFIPLHGIDTVVQAAKLTQVENIHWHLIGNGQEARRIEQLIADQRPNNLTWTPWVPYTELIREIRAADICLGIFGATSKAGRVIPNKVFQTIAAGRPLITRESPAARELLTEVPGVTLIPAADPAALATAARSLLNPGSTEYASRKQDILPSQVVQPLLDQLQLSRHPRQGGRHE